MAVFGMILLAILFVSHQADGAARCTGTSTALICDDSCNEIGRCLGGVWQRTQNCQASGNVCRYDVPNPGQLIPTCVDAMSTEATDGYCTPTNGFDMVCDVTTTTKFPSLLDCTSFYVCEPGNTVYPSQCGGTAYNACRGTCSDPLTNGACPANSTIYCTSPGQVGIAPGYDGLYYTCGSVGTTLQPTWHVCSAGQRYSLRRGACEDVGAVSTCTVCGGATNVPGPIPVANNFCSFIYCYAQNDFATINCRPGWYYVHSERGCIYDRTNTYNC